MAYKGMNIGLSARLLRQMYLLSSELIELFFEIERKQ